MYVQKLNKIELDAGIKKLVYALNARGFETSMSCEGHISELEFQTPYPYVLMVDHAMDLYRAKNMAMRRHENSLNSGGRLQFFKEYECSKNFLDELKVIKEKIRVDYSHKKLLYARESNKNYTKLHELVALYNATLQPNQMIYFDSLLIKPLYSAMQYSLSATDAEKNILVMRESLEKFADFILRPV